MKKYFFLFIILILLPAFFCSAIEFENGNIKLILNERTGRFTLFHTSENTRSGYSSFFSDRDPRTSFLQVMLDNKTYRMGDKSGFVTWINDDENNPAFIFGSYFLRVTQDFTFIKTSGSSVANGVAMRITIENLSPGNVEAGVRFLIDTIHNERSGNYLFAGTDPVTAETMIEKGASERWWVSRRNDFSFMGSISLPGEEWPDNIIFANWKRLNDASWRFPFVSGRSFNVFPFYMRDTAVCYYFQPRTLMGRESVSYTLVFAAEDENGYVHSLNQNPVAHGNISPSEAEARRNDMEMIERLIYQIDVLSAMESVNENEISGLENTLNELLLKYRFNQSTTPP